MPICEADPWRLQYFARVECPPHVNIPTEDFDAWVWYPNERWVYDKIAVAHSQGLAAGPHGTTPPHFPVFSKPIMNLKGMGIGSRVIRSAAEYERQYRAGHMWMTLLEGRHVSSDVAVVGAAPAWSRHVRFLDCAGGARAGDRGALRRVDPPQPCRLHRHAQHRDDRRDHDRSAP